MKYRMAVLDIDGTLLDPQGYVHPAVREAVRAAIRQGVLVTLATGRRFEAARQVAAELGLELPLVLHGGTLIQDSLTAGVLYEDALPPDLLRGTVQAAVSHGQQPVLYRSPAVADELLTGPAECDNAATVDYLARHPVIRRLPYDELAHVRRILSVGVLSYDDTLRPLYDEIVSWRNCKTLLWLRDPTYPEFDNYLLEVFSPGCSKAKALANLAARYGITMDEVMAIGDHLNDLELLTSVGLGVAMGNALPEVKEAAQVVVAPNTEDGVAEALHRYVLDEADDGQP